MIAQCTGTPSAAQPHRDDWPWAQLQRGDASRFLIPPNGAHWSWSFGTNLDSHTHRDASSGAHFALTYVLQRLLFEFIWRIFENLSDFTKAGPRTDRSVVNVAAGCVSVCEAHSGAAGPAENAPQFQSHFHLLNPNKLSPTRQKWFSSGLRSFFLSQVRSVNTFFADYSRGCPHALGLRDPQENLTCGFLWLLKAVWSDSVVSYQLFFFLLCNFGLK